MAINPLAENALQSLLRDLGGRKSAGSANFDTLLDGISARADSDEEPLGLASDLMRMELLQAMAAAERAATQAPVVPSPAAVAARYGVNNTSSEAQDPYADVIAHAARENGLDEKLLRSVIRTESNFDPKAVSSAGAQGLMQLMPETGRELGVTDPFDPTQNIQAGARYLRQQLDRFDGDLEKALAAYNWGPGNLTRKGTDNLPRETRTYIARVLEGINRI